jgi:hypothetical protein
VGRSNPRNLYLVTGTAQDWKADTPVGSMYRRRMGTLVADALNAYVDANPSLLPHLRRDLAPEDHLYSVRPDTDPHTTTHTPEGAA